MSERIRSLVHVLRGDVRGEPGREQQRERDGPRSPQAREPDCRPGVVDGQFNGRGTKINAIIDDVFVNVTHIARFFPKSSALEGLHA